MSKQELNLHRQVQLSCDAPAGWMTERKIMSTLTKYVLLQLPGWILTALLLLGLRGWLGLPLWVAGGVFVFWVGKDFILYPFVHRSYESNTKTGTEELVGSRGVAKEWLGPHGYVQVHGELWKAKAEPSDQPISPHSPIRVQAARGMTLIVTADKNHASGPIFSS
jgi:membrane protein implicated in regulation of membrane protease activity